MISSATYCTPKYQMNTHQEYIERCLQLAELGLGSVAPNPLVGCVVVRNGEIIGEGFHRTFGEAHAEVNALNSVQNDSLLADSTLYVNLEPCSHHGKTPPCANLIIAKKLKRVVIGSRDVNPMVAGQGIQRLRDAGIEVVENILQEECLHLNRRFFTWHQKQRPYIILKWAQSKDGFIDKERVGQERGVNWITGATTRRLVHLWRAQEQAILVGNNTVINDNPSLTVREVAGTNPLRIVVSPSLDFPIDSNVASNEAPTFFFFRKDEGTAKMRNALLMKNETLKFFELNEKNALPEIVSVLHQHHIQSVIVEGGAYTLNQFIEQGLWDEARVLTGEVEFQHGLSAPILSLNSAQRTLHGADEANIFYNK